MIINLFSYSKLHKSRGFTLVEMLVVVGMFSLVVAASSGLLMMSVKNNKKAESITTMRQEGNNAINKVNRMLTYAQSVPTCINKAPTFAFSVQTSDAGITTFRCQEHTIASESARTSYLINPSFGFTLDSCSFICYKSTYGYSFDFSFNLTNALGESESFVTSADMRNRPNDE